jgi:thioredoxin 1
MSTELKVTGFNFESEISKGVTLVDFWAPWCSPCRMQGPVIEKVARQLTGKANVSKCNVDEEPGLASRFGIRSIPTLIIFHNGKEVERLIGLQPENILIEKINALGGKSYEAA